MTLYIKYYKPIQHIIYKKGHLIIPIRCAFQFLSGNEESINKYLLELLNNSNTKEVRCVICVKKT